MLGKQKGAFQLFAERSLAICGLTQILLDFEMKIALWCNMMYHCKKICWTFVGLSHFQTSQNHIILNILYQILNHHSRNNTRFLSIISSILSIYCATSLTFSHRSILPPWKSLLLMLPAPRATMFCFSSIIKIL
mgnify:CR=1 FL=1